jgi:hypothetical protein
MLIFKKKKKKSFYDLLRLHYDKKKYENLYEIIQNGLTNKYQMLGIGDSSRFWLSCSCPLVYLLPKIFLKTI